MAFTNTWFLNQEPIHKKFISKKEQTILEIGAFEGRSTLFFLDHLEGDNSRLDTIDPFPSSDNTCPVYPELYNIFIKNVSPHPNFNKLTVYRDYSQNILPTFLLDQKKYDYILIDGSHLAKDVLFDAMMCFKLLKPGGIIFFDDYEWWGKGQNDPTLPKIGIDAFTSVFKDELKIVQKDYHLVITKVRE